MLLFTNSMNFIDKFDYFYQPLMNIIHLTALKTNHDSNDNDSDYANDYYLVSTN